MRHPFLLAAALVLGPPAAASAESVDPARCRAQFERRYESECGLEREKWEPLCERKSLEEILRRDCAAAPRPTSRTVEPIEDGAPLDSRSGIEGRVRESIARDPDLGPRFDGHAGHGTSAVVVRGASRSRSAASLDRGILRNGRPDRRDAPPQSAPKDVELDEVFQYEPPRSFLSSIPLFGRLLDDFVVRPIRGLFSGEEKRYTKTVLAKLRESEEGRSLVQGLVDDYRRTGRRISIQSQSFSGTEVVSRDGAQSIEGAPRGLAYPETGTYIFNSAFLNLSDPSTLELSASNMGHEFSHILKHRRAESAIKEYADVYEFCLNDEHAARLKGYLVAFELSARDNIYTREAESLAGNEPQFWENLKTGMSNYAIRLDLEEMADPVRSYGRRLVALQKALETDRAAGDEIAEQMRRLEHLEKAHKDKLSGSLAPARAELTATARMLPLALEDAEHAIAEVTKMRDLMRDDAEGKKTAAKLKKAAADPKFRRFVSHEADSERLAALVESKRARLQPAQVDGMTKSQIARLWNQLHESAPGENPPWRERVVQAPHHAHAP